MSYSSSSSAVGTGYFPVGLPSYQNFRPVAWPSERYSPVPGWGMRGRLAGPRQIGIGALGMDVDITLPIVGKQTLHMPIEAAIQEGVEAAWPAIESKLKVSLDEALQDGKKAMHQDVVMAGAVIVGAIALGAWWAKRK